MKILRNNSILEILYILVFCLIFNYEAAFAADNTIKIGLIDNNKAQLILKDFLVKNGYHASIKGEYIKLLIKTKDNLPSFEMYLKISVSNSDLDLIEFKSLYPISDEYKTLTEVKNLVLKLNSNFPVANGLLYMDVMGKFCLSDQLELPTSSKGDIIFCSYLTFVDKIELVEINKFIELYKMFYFSLLKLVPDLARYIMGS